MKLLLIAIAGAAGTLLRYYLGGSVQKAYGGVFPLGTFAVNMAGCLLFGLVWALAEARLTISPEVRAVVLVGFMGAFTTYSTYTFETMELIRTSQWTLAVANVAAHNVTGLIFLALGLAAGKSL